MEAKNEHAKKIAHKKVVIPGPILSPKKSMEFPQVSFELDQQKLDGIMKEMKESAVPNYENQVSLELDEDDAITKKLKELEVLAAVVQDANIKTAVNDEDLRHMKSLESPKKSVSREPSSADSSKPRTRTRRRVKVAAPAPVKVKEDVERAQYNKKHSKKRKDSLEEVSSTENKSKAKSQRISNQTFIHTIDPTFKPLVAADLSSKEWRRLQYNEESLKGMGYPKDSFQYVYGHLMTKKIEAPLSDLAALVELQARLSRKKEVT